MENFLKMVVGGRKHTELASFWEQHGAPLTEKIGEQEVQELMPFLREELQRGRDYWPYNRGIQLD